MQLDFEKKSINFDELDPQIRKFVKFLNHNGFETFTSCQGGEGHSFHKPTVGLTFKGINVENIGTDDFPMKSQFFSEEYIDYKKRLIELLRSNIELFTLEQRTHVSKTVWWEFLYIELSVNSLERFNRLVEQS